MTPLKKQFEFFSNKIIGTINVNSGYCSMGSDKEIVIYRKEEWSKVLIHELIHAFELDFSKNNILSDFAKENTKKVFLNINSFVNLFEAFTETITEIIYILFIISDEDTNRKVFFKKFDKLLLLLQKYSTLQCIDILKHNNGHGGGRGDNTKVQVIFEKMYNGTLPYKEESNILSYYIIKSIFLFYINHFLKCIYFKDSFESVFFIDMNNQIANKEKIICIIQIFSRENLFRTSRTKYKLLHINKELFARTSIIKPYFFKFNLSFLNTLPMH